MTAIHAVILTLKKPSDNAATAAILADAQFLATETGGSTGDTWQWLLLAAIDAMKADNCSKHAIAALDAFFWFAYSEGSMQREDDNDAAYHFVDAAKAWGKAVCGDDW